MCASVSKHYNLVPVKGWWCPADRKVTIGLASHRPWVTTLVVYPPMAARPKEGRWAPRLHCSLYLSIRARQTSGCRSAGVKSGSGVRRCLLYGSVGGGGLVDEVDDVAEGGSPVHVVGRARLDQRPHVHRARGRPLEPVPGRPEPRQHLHVRALVQWTTTARKHLSTCGNVSVYNAVRWRMQWGSTLA